MKLVEETKDFANLQAKSGRFRILIVRRTNAGKTIDYSSEYLQLDGKPRDLRRRWKQGMDPSRCYAVPLYTRAYDQIDPSQVEDLWGNEKLVFHDSQGFEAGREDEFLQMKKFIADGPKTTILKKRIHAIWYCIPMDNVSFIGNLEPRTSNHESLVGRRDEFLIDVGNTTSGFRGLLEGKSELRMVESLTTS